MQTPKISRRRQQRFLAALARDGSVASAAADAQVDRTLLEAARRIDDAFAREWEAAERAAAQKLEREAWRRAINGVPEPLVSEGKVVRDDDGRPLSVQRYSDALLIEMLKMNQHSRHFWVGAGRLHPMKRPIIYVIALVALAIGSLTLWWLHGLPSVIPSR
jgi:hypothetical protein